MKKTYVTKYLTNSITALLIKNLNNTGKFKGFRRRFEFWVCFYAVL